MEGKALTVEAWRGPESFKRLRLPDFKIIRDWKVVRLSALRTSPLYPPPQEIVLMLISVRG